MFERFTTSARHAVVLAQEEARQLNHNYIGTEHVLLGLLGEPAGIAGTVLAGFGVTRDGVRAEVTDAVGTGGAEPSGHMPFTPRAKKTLELALREALALRDNYIGTEHILLGLIREGEGVAALILKKHGDLAAIRTAVIDATSAGNAESAGEGDSAMARWLRSLRGRVEPGGRRPGPPAEAGSAPALRVTPAGEAALSEAASLAGAHPVGSQHLLLAALADTQSAAVKALITLGVDLDQAREALRATDVTGTSDEQPEEAGRRQLAIQVTGETLTLIATDPLLVAAGKAALDAISASAKTASERAGTGEAAAPAAGSAETEGTEAAGAEGTGGVPGTEAAGTEAAGTAATGTVIRGDHPAAASLAAVWLELFKSLEAIRETASRGAGRRAARAVRYPRK